MEPVLEVIDINKSYKNANQKEIIFQLSNINFSVGKGEVLGIAGDNGSGKSTLLKIISGITRPDSGIISYSNKLFSILELGTGFHPDISGYENIILNAKLHGFSHDEIMNKIDAIIDYSELANFINLPVKSYSSGMYLRLAISIALNFDFEILLIDEVINVGDKEFQKKIFTTLTQKINNGLSVILATHDTGLLFKLCNKLLLINKGNTVYYGELNNKILQKYWLSKENDPVNVELAIENKLFKVTNFSISGSDNYKNNSLIFKLDFDSFYKEEFIFSIVIVDILGNNVLSLCSKLSSEKVTILKGESHFICSVQAPKNMLNFGNYKCSLFFSDKNQNDIQGFINVADFEIKLTQNQLNNNEFVGKYPGNIYPLSSWSITSESFK